MLITKEIAGIGAVCSKSKLREQIMGIFVGNGRAVATDAFNLIEVKSPELDCKPVIVPPFKVKKRAVVEVLDGSPANDVVSVVEGGVKTLHPIIKGDFPDYKLVMDNKEPTATILVNAEFLAKVAKIVGAFGENARVELQIKKDRVEILATSKNDEEVRGVIMGINK